MTVYLARERQNAFVEMEELDKYIYISSPTGTEGIIGVFAWSARDHEGRRIFVAARRNQTTLVTNVSQCAVMRAKEDEEYPELHEGGMLLATMERKQKLMSAAPEDLWRKTLREMRVSWMRGFQLMELTCWRRCRC